MSNQRRINRTYVNWKPSTGHLNKSMKDSYEDPYGNSARSKIQAAYSRNANWYQQNTDGYQRINNLEQTKLEQKQNSMIGISGSLEQLRNEIVNLNMNDYIYRSQGISSISTSSLTRDLNKIFDDLYRNWGKATSDNLKKELIPVLLDLIKKAKSKAEDGIRNIQRIISVKDSEISSSTARLRDRISNLENIKDDRLISEIGRLKAEKSVIESRLREIRTVDEDDPDYERMRDAARSLIDRLTSVSQQITMKEDQVNEINRSKYEAKSTIGSEKSVVTKLKVNADDSERILRSFIRRLNTLEKQIEFNKKSEIVAQQIASGTKIT